MFTAMVCWSIAMSLSKCSVHTSYKEMQNNTTCSNKHAILVGAEDQSRQRACAKKKKPIATMFRDATRKGTDKMRN